MTDYIEEQNSELDVLKSIYFEEFNLINEDPIEYEICLPLEDGMFNAKDDDQALMVTLNVTYPEEYPDQLPNLIITPSESCGLDKKDNERLLKELEKIGEENLGMAMIFTLASHLKESTFELIAEKAKNREKEAEARIMASIKADESKFIGTKVTVENFLEWQLKFEAEKNNSKDGSNTFKRNDKKKLTGRQLFEKDSKLAQSDMQFMEEDDVDVDTTQFDRLTISDREKDTNNNEDSGVLDLLRNSQD